MRCPTCKQDVDRAESAYVPFCSKRCKLLDLGRWLDGSYAIPAEPVGDEELEAEFARAGDPKRREH